LFKTIFKKSNLASKNENSNTHVPTVYELTNRFEEFLFESITGYSDIKKLLMRSILSKEQIHILLTGPPAT
jgi:hypothetical protein